MNARRRNLLLLGAVPAVGLVIAMLLWPEPGPAKATDVNSITSPDTEGNVGEYTSLVLDSNGNPVVSYTDSGSGDLKVMHCNDPNCSGGDESVTSPDTVGDVGWHTSLALDVAGNPVASYYDEANDDLKVMHCNDPNCSGGDESITSPDTGGWVGLLTSLALDASGYPVVSYGGNGHLKMMHCNDPNCAGGDESITSPDPDYYTGGWTSVALDASGYPVVSYSDSDHRDLKVMHCNDPNCSGGDESITWPDTDGWVGGYTSLALDASGYPVVSYFEYTDYITENLKVLHCNDPDCAGGDESITWPDTDGSEGWGTSLELDASGYPVVSYYDITNEDLKVLHCNDPDCSDGDESITSPDMKHRVGGYTSLALDASGYPVVSYYDYTYQDLKVLHCGDDRCAKPIGGDVDCDSKVNSIDAAFVLQFGAGLLTSLPCSDGADANGDGTINAIDAALILQFSAGLLDSLPP